MTVRIWPQRLGGITEETTVLGTDPANLPTVLDCLFY
jgi:hypothetical protein